MRSNDSFVIRTSCFVICIRDIHVTCHAVAFACHAVYVKGAKAGG